MHKLATLLGSTALVTKQFSITPNAEDGRYVRIMGRKGGIIDWLLHVMGIDTTTVFEVMHDHIRFTSGNLSGRMTTVIPLSAVSSTSSGYFKPVLYLVLGVPLILAFGLGIIFIIYYFLNKSLLISVENNGGSGAMIAFKRSLIEGIKVDHHQAAAVVEIINERVLALQAGARV